MENKLKELTQKIYAEGITKANEEAVAIIERAKEEADALISKAQHQAAEILEKANNESNTQIKNTQSELAMSIKQAITAFKQELTTLITTSLVAPVKETVSEKEFVEKILVTVVNNWKADNPDIDLNVMLPSTNQKELEEYLEAKVKKLLDTGLTLNFNSQHRSGFKIGPKDGGYVISFTDQDFENFFKTYARPKLREFLYGGK